MLLESGEEVKLGALFHALDLGYKVSGYRSINWTMTIIIFNT
jgi:hypothetical protein